MAASDRQPVISPMQKEQPQRQTRRQQVISPMQKEQPQLISPMQKEQPQWQTLLHLPRRRGSPRGRGRGRLTLLQIGRAKWLHLVRETSRRQGPCHPVRSW